MSNQPLGVCFSNGQALNTRGGLPAPTGTAEAAPYNESVNEALEALRANLTSVRFALAELHSEAEENEAADNERLYALWNTIDHHLERIENAELAQTLFGEKIC